MAGVEAVRRNGFSGFSMSLCMGVAVGLPIWCGTKTLLSERRCTPRRPRSKLRRGKSSLRRSDLLVLPGLPPLPGLAPAPPCCCTWRAGRLTSSRPAASATLSSASAAASTWFFDTASWLENSEMAV